MTANATADRPAAGEEAGAAGVAEPAPQYLAGAACVCLAVFCFAIQDALIKYLSGLYPIYQFLLMRSITMVPILGAAVWWEAGAAGFRIVKPGFVLLRGIVLLGAYLTYSLSLARLALADATAIYFTLPLFVAALAGPMLGERVPVYRWLAIISGFTGVIVMLRPGYGVFEPAALLALAGAFLYGVGQMMSGLFPGNRTSSIAFYQSCVYLVGAIVLTTAFGSGSWASAFGPEWGFLVRAWTEPTARDLALMLAFGPLSAIGMPLYVHGYKVAPTNFAAPFEYTSMMWAVVLGFLLFGALPGVATVVGAAIVVGAGLFMVWNDGRVARG